MSIIAPYDRLALQERFRNAEPFRFFVVDDFLRREFADEVAASFPSYEQAARIGRTFGAVNEMGKVQLCDFAAFPPPAKDLADAICDQAFLDDLELITGTPKLLADRTFAGGGIHQTKARGWLDVHVDFNVLPAQGLFRRLNILIYLNPEWDARWAGQLELWDRDVQRCLHSVAPIHNRCVVFETTDFSFHGVAAVRCPPGFARKSFAAYYYTREAPRDSVGERRETLFVARPREYMKRHVLMPAVTAKRSLASRAGRARRALVQMLGRK